MSPTTTHLIKRGIPYIICEKCKMVLYEGIQQELSQGHYQVKWKPLAASFPTQPLRFCPVCEGNTTQQVRRPI